MSRRVPALMLLLAVLARAQEATTIRAEDPGWWARVARALGRTVEESEGSGGVRLDLGDGPVVVVRGRPAAPERRRSLQVVVPALAEAGRALRRRGFLPEEDRSLPGGVVALRLADPEGRLLFVRTRADATRSALPALGALNPVVLEVLAEYPQDGSHPYHWPKQGGWRGCTKDLRYGGEVVSRGDPEGRAYCCGLTFEVFLESWRRWCEARARPFRIKDLDVAGVRRLQSQWFGSAKDPTCLRTALLDNGLGRRIERLAEARAGDFLQLWRANGSGHSVVFLDWVREGGRIVGLRYWSTQKSTQGIGERVERFGATGRGVDRERFYLCRVGVSEAR